MCLLTKLNITIHIHYWLKLGCGICVTIHFNTKIILKKNKNNKHL